MHHRRLRLAGWIAALGSLLSPLSGSAAPPIGSFGVPFGGNHSIWFGDGEGGYDESFCEAFAEGIDEIEYCDFEIFVDGNGKLYGYIDLAAWDDGIRLSLYGPLKGSQRGDGQTGIARTTFFLKVIGDASDGFVTAGVKGSIRYTGQVAPGGVASGVWDQRFCVKGAGCESYQTVAPMEILTHGGWTLGLEIGSAGGGALNGTALAKFSDGSECVYAIRGKHSAKTDTASLGLTPITPECAGTSIRLSEVRALQPLRTRDGVGEITDFVCTGTLTITASVDPAACVWAIPGSEQPLAATDVIAATIEYKLFGFAGETTVPSARSSVDSYFGRATFGWSDGSTLPSSTSGAPASAFQTR